MNKICILVGPPGSGKSTHATAMEAQGYLRISQDDQGKEGHRELFESHVATGRDIVVDRMNFDKFQRDRYRLEAIKNGYTVDIVEFVTPYQVCYDRCMERQGHPTINGKVVVEGIDHRKELNGFYHFTEEQKSKSTKSALHTYFSKYEEVTEDEGELLRVYWNSEQKSDAIMVDIDGTLANLDHRLHHVKDGKKDWGKFFRECTGDKVYPDVKRILELEGAAGTAIVLCSGRPDDYREHTEKWLAWNEITYTSLKMRPRQNFKQDAITKLMLYRYEIKPFYNVLYVLDDRTQVVDAWRKIGLSCLQVRPGDF